ncbi:MAG: DNA repair protein RecN [Alphaproteobacteria bacterium]|nr:DNA repair protein RecN [Alphaproteobacteria bacterium]
MLTALTIQHFVLIDSLNLTFDRGLGVFTGETGAGKSILLDALSLVLGARSETRFIQHGSDQAVVSATFSLPKSHPVFRLLKDQGLEADEDLILRRTLSKDGKTKAFICDQPVSIGLLKSVGDLLVEIHAQFASHALLNPATHLATLDRYGKLEKQAAEVADAWHKYQKALAESNEFEQNLNTQLSEEDLLRADLEALDKLNPKEDEEETLTKRRAALMNAEHIVENIQTACALLGDDEQGILRLIGRTENQLFNANKTTEGRFDNELKSLAEAGNILSDLSSDLEHALNDLGDTSELPMIDDRLFALRDMARKYRISIAELPAFREEVRQKLSLTEHGTQKLADLKQRAEELRQAYYVLAKGLSNARHKAAIELNKAVMAELPTLKLEKAIFETAVTDVSLDQGSATGLNEVVFMVAFNKGSPMNPIHKCASGGELSRFMLALKVNLTEDNNRTLIFDEIDTGISGATAAAVGERLARLAEKHQTLVITHSPQVAGFGKHHYLVQKADVDDKTLTSVLQLDKAGRLEEIARLVSGATVTEKSRAVAKELLKV